MTTSQLLLLIGSIYLSPHMSEHAGWSIWAWFMVLAFALLLVDAK